MADGARLTVESLFIWLLLPPISYKPSAKISLSGDNADESSSISPLSHGYRSAWSRYLRAPASSGRIEGPPPSPEDGLRKSGEKDEG